MRYCSPGDEYEVAVSIASDLDSVANLKGVLLLAPTTNVNCTQLLEGIVSEQPELVVFGGGAAVASTSTQRPCVFLNNNFFENGVVIVAFCGKDLNINYHVLFDWKPLGPQMTLTRTDGFNICSIDKKPAIEVYQKYLDVERDASFKQDTEAGFMKRLDASR